MADPEEIIHYYNGTHISPRYLHGQMSQLNDLFSVPQVYISNDIFPCNPFFDPLQSFLIPFYSLSLVGLFAKRCNTIFQRKRHQVKERIYMRSCANKILVTHEKDAYFFLVNYIYFDPVSTLVTYMMI